MANRKDNGVYVVKKLIKPFVLLLIANILSGCGIIRVEDNYSLDSIEGDITCEYRIGKDAMWAEQCVDTDIEFDKDMFLKLFHEYNQYDPLKAKKILKNYDLKIDPDEQPEIWQTVNDSEFNVRAVFAEGQRNVSIYRHEGKLYYFVLSMGGQSEPEKKGVYFMELSEEMQGYWQGIIEAVEKEIQ